MDLLTGAGLPLKRIQRALAHICTLLRSAIINKHRETAHTAQYRIIPPLQLTVLQVCFFKERKEKKKKSIALVIYKTFEAHIKITIVKVIFFFFFFKKKKKSCVATADRQATAKQIYMTIAIITFSSV